MKSGNFGRHRYRQSHRLAAVVLVAAACGFSGTLAHAQSDGLISASQRGDLPAVNALLVSNSDVNAKLEGGDTALLLAAQNGHLGVVRALLAAKVDVNARGT